MRKIDWKPKSDLEKAGLNIVRLLNKQKYQAFFVGGYVRDLFTKKASNNIDIATDALPDDVEKALDKANIHYKQIGKKFGTILAIVDNQQIEITTFRRESRYSDQRHPDEVEFIREYLNDAQRRDFTINAMYLNPVSGELFDPVKGTEDIKKEIVRFVGDPKKRIDEDSLRMLRAVRFSTTLGFKLEKNSFAAIKTRAKLIQGVSGERVKQELDKILISENRTFGIKILDEIGLLKFILPELIELKRINHKSPKHHQEGDMFKHTLLAVEAIKDPNPVLIYAALFHDIGKASVKLQKIVDPSGWEYLSTIGHEQESYKVFNKFANKYRFSRKDKDLISWLILRHDDRTNYREMGESKRIQYSLNPDFPMLLKVWLADSQANIRRDENGQLKPGNSVSVKIGNEILKKIETKKELINKFSGGDFIMRETKLSPGIRIGQISEKIKIKIVLGEIKNENDAKNFLKKFVKSIARA